MRFLTFIIYWDSSSLQTSSETRWKNGRFIVPLQKVLELPEQLKNGVLLPYMDSPIAQSSLSRHDKVEMRLHDLVRDELISSI